MALERAPLWAGDAGKGWSGISVWLACYKRKSPSFGCMRGSERGEKHEKQHVKHEIAAILYGWPLLVGARGFEPPTPTTPLWCATRLRYAPM